MKTLPGERIRLKDTTCPLIRIDTARRKDKSLSFSLSLLVHIAIFSLVGLSLIKAPQFAVDQGEGSIEVNLVAAPAEPAPPEQVIVPVVEKTDLVEKVVPVPAPPKLEIKKEPIRETRGKDQVTAQSTGGAITAIKPDYLKNPAPVYPESARRRGQEGVVVLNVLVDKNGRPVRIMVKSSSGFELLDNAAVKSVWEWTFQAAKLGSMPVESSVDIPLRFRLKE